MKSNYLLTFFMLFGFLGFAQNLEIGGVVKESASGAPIPGANVQLKNTNRGTTTDLDGKFSLKEIPAGAIVVVSYLGYRDVEYKVTESKNDVSVALQETTNTLDEIVVIGYGTQKKKEVTGAVSVLNSKTIEALKPVNAEQALQGTVSGVMITSTGGSPGAGFNIFIRGVSTNQTNKPLIIIDGYVGELGMLNPNDIESMTVLKDSQAAIYGTVAGNGVILVTTKKGRKNSPVALSYNGYTGFQETSKKMNLLNATEYALLLNESYANGGRPLPYPNVSGLGRGTNWQDEMFDKAPIVSHDFTLSGGGEKITYAVSGSDLTQEGIIGDEKSHYKRNTARIALGADLTDKLKLQTNFIYSAINRKTFNDLALGSVLFNALNAPPTLAPYDTDGNFSLVPNSPGLGIEIINPLAQLENTYNDYNRYKISGTVSLDYEITKDLTLSSRIGFNSANSDKREFAKIVGYGGKVFDVTRSSVTQSAFTDKDYTFDAFANYKKTFGEDHNFALMVGTTIIKNWGTGLYATGFDVPNNSWEFADISLATGLSTSVPVRSYNYDDRRNSQFARLQYNFREKYFVSFMGRRDASTYFGPNNTLAYFPSMTAGWVISKEGFFPENGFISFLKLRGSYGALGNDQIGANRYIGSLSGEATYVFNGELVNGTAIGVLANPNVAWEKSKKLDIGLDLNLWKNKIEINSDYYSNTTSGLLVEGFPVSAITGIAAPGSGAPTVNAGSTKNSGFEVAINYTDKLSEKLKIGIGYTITTVKNEVTDILGDNNFVEAGAFGVGQLRPARMEEGFPLGYFYGYQTDGIFQNQAEVDAHPSQIALGAEAAPGDLRFKDINGDGIIDSRDRTNLGDPIPEVIMGFNLNLNYRDFDFTAYAYASLGNDMIRNYERTLSDVNRLDYLLDRWTGEGTSNTVPRVTTDATSNNVFSDYFVEDASYLRIQNVQLGYTLNKEFTKKARIERVRIYFGVNNLYTFTKYKGFDPGAMPVNSQSDIQTSNPLTAGIDNGIYPIARTYMFGINLNF